MIRQILAKLAGGQNLTEGEMIDAMTAVMGGEATSAQIGAFLMALRIKGITAAELTGAARVFRSVTPPIHVGDSLVSLDRDEINVDLETMADTARAGGAGTSTFNVSTATAFVVAACGVKVAKHGVRAVSPLCGSADVLAALSVELDLPPSAVEDCIETVGVGFFYEPLFHSASKHVAGPRKELGLRTLFNLLGPLANPAGARCQVLGVHAKELTRVLAETLGNLGADRAMAVHGEDGMDEITVCGLTHVAELTEGKIEEYTVAPEDFGIPRAQPSEIQGGDAQQNASIVRSVLAGDRGPKQDVVLLNAAAALYVVGRTPDLTTGVEAARQALDSGEAQKKLHALVERTRRLGDRWYREA